MLDKIGIQGCGRVGKNLVRLLIKEKIFPEIVVWLGRECGTGLNDFIHYLWADSTYGNLATLLWGPYSCYDRSELITELDYATNTFVINDVKIRIMTEERIPYKLNWRSLGVKLVIDTTGQHKDPFLKPDDPRSPRGHIESDHGAEVVIITAPFKSGDKSKNFETDMPDDAAMVVFGIDSERCHQKRIISAASCTTTCAVYVLKVLLDVFGKRIVCIWLTTVHGETSTQPVLDKMPAAGAKDLRKCRSVENNIIPTGTGAAKSVRIVLKEVRKVPFNASCIRVKTNTVSLANFSIAMSGMVDREEINEALKMAALGRFEGLLRYSPHQNVSTDFINGPFAAAVIEGEQTHVRTGTVDEIAQLGQLFVLEDGIYVPVNIESELSLANVSTWYDNETGSFIYMLINLIKDVAEQMQEVFICLN